MRRSASWRPCLLLVLRLLQGVSIGGEYTTSAIFLGEVSPVRWRGFITSFSAMGATGGILLGSAVGAATASVMSQEALVAWGWRVPFLLGIVLGLSTLVLRQGTQESAVPATELREAPLVQAFLTDGANIARSIALNAMLGVGFYMLLSISPPTCSRWTIWTAALPSRSIPCPWWCWCCSAGLRGAERRDRPQDRDGRLAGGADAGAWPLFRMLDGGSPGQVQAAQVMFAVLMSAYMGPMPACWWRCSSRRPLLGHVGAIIWRWAWRAARCR